MPYEWNEDSTLVFLKVYQKYPCLWNPHDVKYYNCLAKNEALKSIIKELDITELNISDCLEQIRVIREKYGQEQIQMIKSLQFQKPYKSSLPWFPVIAEMLAKIINDEDKSQKGIKSVEMKSRTIFKDCTTTPRDRYKNMSNFHYVYEEDKKYNFKYLEEIKHKDYEAKSRENAKFIKAGYTSGESGKLDDKNEKKYDAQLNLSQCPHTSCCGWEDVKSDRVSITAKTTCEPTQLLDNAVPCLEYVNLVDKLYKKYNPYRYRIVGYRRRCNNIIPCSSFSRNVYSPSYTRYCTNKLTTDAYRDTCDHVSDQSTRQEAIVPKSKCAKEMQLSSKQLLPEKRTKRVDAISVEHSYNKEIQNTICVSKTNITLPTSKCTSIMLQTSSDVQVSATVRKCDKEVQSKLSISQEKLKQRAVNTVEQCDKAIQNTICVSASRVSDCRAIGEYSSTIQESKRFDKTIVKCHAKDTQNMRQNIGVKSNIGEYSTPNFELIITIDGNYLPLVKTDFRFKLMKTVKCQTDNLCRDQENTINISIQEDIKRKDAIDIFTFSSEIKECADQILNIYTVMDRSKKQLLNKLSPKYRDKPKDKYSPNPLNWIQTQASNNHADQFTTPFSYATLKDKKLSYRLSTSKSKDYDPLKNHTMTETAEEQSPVEEDYSKEITAHTENQDAYDKSVDLNVPLSQTLHRDFGTQNVSKQLQDIGVITEHRESFRQKASVGTQRYGPILLRVVKCSNSEGILKFDRETRVSDTYVAWTRNAIDERRETYPIFQHLPENTYRRHTIREFYNEGLLRSGISHSPEKEANRMDYHRSLSSNKNYMCKNYMCDKEHKKSLSSNQDSRKSNTSTFASLSNQRVSKIPLYVRSHAQRRNNLYKSVS